MNRLKAVKPLFALYSLALLGALPAYAATDVWVSHITNAAAWKTGIACYNPGATAVRASLVFYDPSGSSGLPPVDLDVPPMAWASVSAADLDYNCSARLTASANLEVKLSYQYGDSPSVCEFFLTGETSRAWMLPNTVRSWMNYTGVALVNPGPGPATVTFEAWQNGNLVAASTATVPAFNQYVQLSNGIWPGMAYEGFDTVRIRSDVPLPAPIDITGNLAGDRHLFFSARPASAELRAGDLVVVDPLVGNLRFVPPGTFTQGSPAGEPCRQAYEAQFTHILTSKLAVMETEVSRQMWANLKAVQPTLPNDPSHTTLCPGMSNPAGNMTWLEAVLFANLLSAQQGLTPCYYADSALTIPVTAANYTTYRIRCKWDAPGYRLPSEGEWEYFCRAGTTTPFWISEPNYTASNCGSDTTPGEYPALETAAWFWGNCSTTYLTGPVGAKAANPWNLRDVAGNVSEQCWDCFAENYPIGTVTDYHGPASGTKQVARGGSYGINAVECRSADRQQRDAVYRIADQGFRLVRMLP